MREAEDHTGLFAKIAAALGIGGVAVFARMGDSCADVGRAGARVAAETPASALTHNIDDAAIDFGRLAEAVHPVDVATTAIDVGDLALQLADLVDDEAPAIELARVPVGGDREAAARACLARGRWCLAIEERPGLDAAWTRTVQVADREHREAEWVFGQVAAETGAPATWFACEDDGTTVVRDSRPR